MNPDSLITKLAEARLTESVDPDILAVFREALRLGIGSVTLHFSGSGDSGDLNDTTISDLDGKDLYNMIFDKVERGPNSYTYEPRPNPVWTPEHDVFLSKMDDFFYNSIGEKIDWDWYNNDGGGGSATVNFVTGAVDISGYYNTQVATDGVCYNMLKEEE